MKFEDINIHQALIEKLQHSISDGRIAHAQYFQGDHGSGNLPLAIAYAQEVLSQGSSGDMFGGKDDRASRLNHPDLHIVFPVVQGDTKVSAPQLQEFREAYLENPYLLFSDWLDRIGAIQKAPIITVHEAAEIYKKLSLRSFEGGYKILIIWQAELMNAACSNKLLKLIEEPPDQTLIILVGTDIGQLLPTIRSRVQLVDCKPLTNTEMKTALILRGVDQDKVSAIIEEAEGSIGKAMSISSDTDEDDMFDSYKRLLRIALLNNVPEAIKWIDETVAKGKAFQKGILTYGLEIYRQSNINNFIANSHEHNSAKDDFLNKFSPFITLKNIEKLMEANNDAHYKLTRNGYSKLVLFDWIIKLMRLIKR